MNQRKNLMSRQENTILKIAKNPFTGLCFDVISLILSVLAFKIYTWDWMIFAIYLCPFVLSAILLIVNQELYKKNRVLIKEKEKSLESIYAYNLREIAANLKKELTNISLAYNDFRASVDSEAEKKPEEDFNDIYNKQLQQYYKELNSYSHSIFRSVVKSVKNMVEHAINIEDVEISVCIKQLDTCFHKKSNSIPSDLKVFAVYRDERSYKKGREIGQFYTVNGNSTFRSCIMNNKSREAYFIENNLKKAISTQSCHCENADSVLANNTYSAVMVVPICTKIQSDWYYYGFLCIDTYTDINEIFTEKLLPILQFFSEIIAIFYRDITTYFPTIFDHLNHNISEECIYE